MGAPPVRPGTVRAAIAIVIVGLVAAGCEADRRTRRVQPTPTGSTAGAPGARSIGGVGGTGGTGGAASAGGRGGGGGASGRDASLGPDARRMVDAAAAPDRVLDRVRAATPDLPPSPPSGLVGHWRFDEPGGVTAVDSARSANDGLLVAGAALVPTGFPTATFPNRGALSLDGRTGYVVLGTNRLPPVSGFKTVALWFNYAALPAGTRNFVSFTNGEALCGLQLGIRGGKLAVWGWGGARAQLLETPPAAAGWHHLAYTFDGATHTMAIDGITLATSRIAPQTCEVLDAIVGSYAGGAENFGGLIDDLRVYTRALGPREIETLARGGDLF